MPKENLKIIFDEFLNGTSSKEELETLMDSFQEQGNSSLNNRIRYELEKEDTIDHSFQWLEISNRVLNSLIKKRIAELYAKYLDERISGKELVELRGYLEIEIINADTPYQTDGRLPIKETNRDSKSSTLINFDRYREGQLKANHFFEFLSKKWSSIAASILFAGILGLIWIFSDSVPTGSAYTDISLPTQNEATVLFDDGHLMSVLKSDKNLLLDRGIEIVHLANNEVAFKIHANPKIPSHRQTFYSPKGTISQLILSDGTHIWLNSATKITYASSFPETERRIAVTGEAYLEVSRNISKPFIVDADGTQIRVLGTAFNVATNVKNGYVLTTLLHGSVEIGTAQQKQKITPGMQSISSKNNGAIHTYNVNLTDEMAWKSGFFKFNDDDVYTILDKIKTWYNIEDYEVQSTTNDRFSGTIKRTRKLSELLQNLEKISGYKFKIIDRRVIAMK